MPAKKGASGKKKSSPAPKKATNKNSNSKTKETPPEAAPQSESSALDLPLTSTSDFPDLFKKIDKSYHEYLSSVLNNPIRQFQKSTVDDYVRLIEQKGLPRAVAESIDARDYTRGNSWEQANMNIMNSLLPRSQLLNELLKEAVKDDCQQAVKWYPEASGNPKEITEVLKTALKSKEPKNRWWAAIHLSKHGPDSEGLVDVLLEAVQASWVALKLDNSSSGISGKGEAAKALGRLGKKASAASSTLYDLLADATINSADASQIAGALLPIDGDVEKILSKVATIAERVLTEKRGLLIHGGDRELLSTTRNLIAKWSQSEGAKCQDLANKVELLEKEIKYHISL